MDLFIEEGGRSGFDQIIEHPADQLNLSFRFLSWLEEIAQEARKLPLPDF
jgi:hypothetical protein